MNLSTIVAIFILGWFVGFCMASAVAYRYITVRRELYEAHEQAIKEQAVAVESAKIVLAREFARLQKEYQRDEMEVRRGQ